MNSICNIATWKTNTKWVSINYLIIICFLFDRIIILNMEKEGKLEEGKNNK
jgi:hypothetical protein